MKLPEPVMLVEESDISKLTDEQIEKICLVAEETARKYILSKISPKNVETLNICAEVEGTKPIKLTMDIDVVLSPLMRNFNIKELANEAVVEAFKEAEKWMR